MARHKAKKITTEQETNEQGPIVPTVAICGDKDICPTCNSESTMLIAEMSRLENGTFASGEVFDLLIRNRMSCGDCGRIFVQTVKR